MRLQSRSVSNREAARAAYCQAIESAPSNKLFAYHLLSNHGTPYRALVSTVAGATQNISSRVGNRTSFDPDVRNIADRFVFPSRPVMKQRSQRAHAKRKGFQLLDTAMHCALLSTRGAVEDAPNPVKRPGDCVQLLCKQAQSFPIFVPDANLKERLIFI